MRFCELKEKDVINRCDCKKLGQICDLVIDECSGQICSIIVPGPPRHVIGLAAVIIGEVVFGKIFRNFALKLTASVIGAIIYYIVMNFVLRMGLSTDDLKLLTALVVAVFLTIPYWKGKYFTKVPVKKGGKDNA